MRQVSTAPVLTCRGLRKKYGERTAVDGVSFEIARGECYGLLGPNGAGKTTTISMICGLVERDAGEVTVAGARIDHHSVEARSHIGYVPQEVALYPDLSATENLRFFGKLEGLEGKELDQRVQDALESVGLADRARERLDRFSGGMRRRANLAVGILHRPDLLMLDEPTVGVDPQSRNAIFELVRELAGSGMSILYTTHYMEEAERLCDRIGVMDEGRLVAEGTPNELVESIGVADKVRVVVSSGRDSLAAELGRLRGAESVECNDDGIELLAAHGRTLLRDVLDAAERVGVVVDGVEVIRPDLEVVFLKLTGKALRD
jgi:ABC-2 type transport system ATP-binding protein